MSEWGGEKDAAMADVTDSMTAATIQPENTDHAQQVRDAKWAEKEGFNYEAYNADSREKREAIEAEQDLPGWAHDAVKYEWDEDYGDVGPEFKELEDALFGDDTKTSKGDQFSNIAGINVTIESETKVNPVASFEDAGLHPVMLANVKKCGYEIPTPIQAYVLPAIFKDQDVIGIAQTGSGKTAAYLVPTLSKLMGKAKKLAASRPNPKDYSRADAVRAEPLILVVAPTRELATQIFDEARRLCYRSMLRPSVIYGGAPVREQRDDLGKGCDVLIATPGRLIDFLQKGSILSLRRVKYTIIDEADEMVSDDWAEEMAAIMGTDSNDDDDHVYMMFSATFPKEARKVAKKYMASDHVRVRVGRIGSTHLNVSQKILFVDDSKKRDCIWDLLLSMPPARTMIFVNSKKSADFLDDFLYNRGLPTTSIHADRTQREREDAIRAFKTGKAPVLITTGVSARGLDIKNVMHIVNYDLPASDQGGIHEYIHRIGRTARIGNIGLATSFYNERNEDLGEALTKILIESQQEVPDFLSAYKPEDNAAPLEFNDDSEDDDDDAANGDGGDGGWAPEEPAEANDGGWN